MSAINIKLYVDMNRIFATAEQRDKILIVDIHNL